MAVAEANAKLVTAVMALIISIVTQDTSRISLYESPLMYFLAVYGVDSRNKTYRSVFTYTPILA